MLIFGTMSIIMQAFVLVGDLKKCASHIQSFCEKNTIPSYYVHEFESLKISDARNLSHLLSQKLPVSQKQVISIKNPTLEAQNAILKLVEEVPESTFIFFQVVVKENLLPTIISRTQVLDFSENNQYKADETIKKELWGVFENAYLADVFLFCDTYMIEKDSIDSVIAAARELLLEHPERMQLFRFLTDVIKASRLIKNNNVQGKLTLEVLLEKSCQIPS